MQTKLKWNTTAVGTTAIIIFFVYLFLRYVLAITISTPWFVVIAIVVLLASSQLGGEDNG